MSLSPAHREILRNQLLDSLRTAASVGLPSHTLRASASMSGFHLDEAALEAEMHYLVSAGLAEETRSAVSAGLKRWTISAKGIEHLEAAGY